MQKPPPFANTVFASWVWRASHAFKQALPGLNKAGGWGGQPPPFANTVLASWVWKGLACSQAQCSHHGFGRASHALKRALPGLKQAGGVGGGGGRSPPHLQTQCSHHGFGGPRKKKRGGWGAQPPPHLQRARRGVWNDKVERSGPNALRGSFTQTPDLGARRGSGTTCEHLGRASHAFKHSARIVGFLEGPRML